MIFAKMLVLLHLSCLLLTTALRRSAHTDLSVGVAAGGGTYVNASFGRVFSGDRSTNFSHPTHARKIDCDSTARTRRGFLGIAACVLLGSGGILASVATFACFGSGNDQADDVINDPSASKALGGWLQIFLVCGIRAMQAGIQMVGIVAVSAMVDGYLDPPTKITPAKSESLGWIGLVVGFGLLKAGLASVAARKMLGKYGSLVCECGTFGIVLAIVAFCVAVGTRLIPDLDFTDSPCMVHPACKPESLIMAKRSLKIASFGGLLGVGVPLCRAAWLMHDRWYSVLKYRGNIIAIIAIAFIIGCGGWSEVSVLHSQVWYGPVGKMSAYTSNSLSSASFVSGGSLALAGATLALGGELDGMGIVALLVNTLCILLSGMIVTLVIASTGAEKGSGLCVGAM